MRAVCRQSWSFRAAGRTAEDIADSNGKRIYFCSKDSVGWIELGGEAEHTLTVEVLQPILEQYVEGEPTSAIEYVHSDEALAELTSGYDNLGFIMPALNKDEFFDMIVKCGVLKNVFDGERRTRRDIIWVSPALGTGGRGDRRKKLGNKMESIVAKIRWQLAC